MINFQDREKKKDKKQKEKSKPVRLDKKTIEKLDRIKNKRDFNSYRKTLQFWFDRTEEELMEELESGKSIFCEKVVESSDKYLEDGSFDKKLIADFLFILNNHESNKEYITNILEEMREELNE